MELLMKRIAMQLGMIEYPKELEANATSEEAAAPEQQEVAGESDSE